MDLKNYIIASSKKVGIDLIGFTDCEPLLNMKEYLNERKKNNIETEFEEKNIEKRIFPKLAFPNCKSIIVIGISYNNNFNEKNEHASKGQLSRSSWGIDYHTVLEGKLKKLIKEIKRKKDFQFKYFVDTGPLIDRELAKKAGIGHYGKNTSIINEEFGSFIFLGYILSDLDVETSSILAKKSCGNCSRCIEYCPTGALEGDYKFNPKRCISYLTQTRDKIPYELRELMGNKIYGCDTCQLACPKNTNIKKPSHPEFIPKDTKGYVDIKELLNMSNREFKEKYSSMSGGWRGRNILRRNGIIVLANEKDKDNLEILESFINDPSPMIREYVAWAILKTDNKVGRKLVEKRFKIEKDKDVKLELRSLMEYFE